MIFEFYFLISFHFLIHHPFILRENQQVSRLQLLKAIPLAVKGAAFFCFVIVVERRNAKEKKVAIKAQERGPTTLEAHCTRLLLLHPSLWEAAVAANDSGPHAKRQTSSIAISKGKKINSTKTLWSSLSTPPSRKPKGRPSGCISKRWCR